MSFSCKGSRDFLALFFFYLLFLPNGEKCCKIQCFIGGASCACGLRALAAERPNYSSLPSFLFGLLNQMVPSLFAVPGHVALQPAGVWDPQPCRWFITIMERSVTSNHHLIHLPLRLSLLYLSSLFHTGCQPHYFLAFTFSIKQTYYFFQNTLLLYASFFYSSLDCVHFITKIISI